MTKTLLPLAAAALLTACASTSPRQPPAADPYAALPAAPAAEAGAIYASGQNIALFEDVKARNVGDLLTVLLVEKTQAKKSAATSTSKESGVTLGDVTVFGKGVNFDTGISGSREFAGKGDTSQSNSLSGSVTVTVVQRYANGNLRVAGEKSLRLNQGSEVVRLEGIVRAADIGTGNTISSDRVANARVTYAGKGALADSNAQGWLSRFFNSPWIPF